MSKIVIEFDTVSKSASATMDDTAVADFDCAYISKRYCYDDEKKDPPQWSCCVESKHENGDEDLTTRTSTYASRTPTQKTVVYASEGPTPTQQSIREFFVKHSK